MTLSWRILALILVTFIAPWVLRDHAGKGITSADAVLSTSMIAESRSVMKNASVVNVKKDFVGEYWGKLTKPQNLHNTTPLTQNYSGIFAGMIVHVWSSDPPSTAAVRRSFLKESAGEIYVPEATRCMPQQLQTNRWGRIQSRRQAQRVTRIIRSAQVDIP